ncbi:MAG: SdrD B-like domain-containing protein, partial [Saprospiraceae bacterium]
GSILLPGQSTTLTLELTLLTGSIPTSWNNYSEVSATQDDQGNNRNDDADSVADTNVSNDNPVLPGDPDDNNILGLGPNAGQDEDDHDPAAPDIYDIALSKTLITAGPFQYGQTIQFLITLTNQGNRSLSNILVRDALPCGMTYVGGSQPWNIVGNEATTMYSGVIPPFESRTLVMDVSLQPCFNNPASAWTNFAEVMSMDDDGGNDVSNEDPDSDPGNGPSGGSEDDDDEVLVEIFDLALRKTLTTNPPYNYNQTHVFNIEIHNQGNVAASNIVINDYLPAGYGFAPNNGWTGISPTIQLNVPGIIPPGGMVVMPLHLTLLQTSGGENEWINYSEVASANGPQGPGFDADSNPNSNTAEENNVLPNSSNDNVITGGGPTVGEDEDDHDPAGPSIFDLALTKTIVTALPSYSYGQIATYSIEVFNQGNNAAGTIVLSDYVPCGLEFDGSLPNNTQWSVAAPGRITSTLNYILNPGQSTTILLDLRVIPCYNVPENAWTNFTEITTAIDVSTGIAGLDIDSNPDTNQGNDGGGVPDFNGVVSGTDNTINNQNGDEDDQDPHKIQVFDLALRKLVDDRGPYMIGQMATFRLTIFNQGNVPATNIIVNDYIRSGFIFNGGVNLGWTMVNAPTPLVDGLLTYNIGSVLQPGQSIELVLNLEVALDANPAIEDWYNYGEIGSAMDTQGNNRNDDADSQPNTNATYENVVLPDDPWDNIVDGRGPNFNEDEDDHDPEKILVVGGLGDTVWKDLNGNGIQEIGEPGIQKVIVRLQDCAGNTLKTALTDADGFYFFDNLLPGNYQIKFDISGIGAGCQFTLQDQGGNDELDSDVSINGLGPCLYLQAGTFDSTYDAGLLFLAAIGDLVWHDLNGDGIQTPGEPGMEGLKVELFKADGTAYGVTYTDVNGRYLFDWLYPGDYYVRFEQPAGFDLTLHNVGFNDFLDNDVDGSNGPNTTATTTLISGERDMSWDAGYYTCIPIGEVVWYDFNKNDIRDGFENGINGLSVNIFKRVQGVWQLFDSTYTGHKPGTPSEDGYWKFCVPPGTYYVHVDMPPLGLVRVRPNIGGDPNRDSDLTNANGQMTTTTFNVSSGQMKCDLGFGFYPMAVTGNTVWIDQNINGIQEGNEPRVEGAFVEARDVVTNAVLKTAITDHNGNYEMEYLERGNVYFRFELPSDYSGYVPTLPRAGQDNEDSDVDGSFGSRTTRQFEMEPTMANMDIDFGIVQGVLPVDWLFVNGKKENNHHLITWATAREVNTSHYVLERKRQNEKEFSPLSGTIPAKGYSSKREDYSALDNDVSAAGLYTYRIKQIDFDGKFTYSNEVRLSNLEKTSMDIYPNPAKSLTNLVMSLSSDATVTIQIIDNAGSLVRLIKSSALIEKGFYNEVIDLQGIPSGMYTVRIDVDDEQIQRKLVIID